MTPLTSSFEMDALVADARAELGMNPLDPEMTTVLAAQAALRRWQRTEISDRQLTSWAHRAIGHDGPQVLLDLVNADDVPDAI